MALPTNYRNEIRKRTIRGAPQVGTHHGEGPSDGAQRNARIAAMSAQRKEQNRSDKEKKIADRTADAEKRKKETLAMAIEESKENSGTEVRTKIKNVARPDDAEPTSKESTLAKTSEIKKKKIDEGRSMSINRNFGLSESLIAATRALLEKKHDDDMKSIGKSKTEVDTKPTTNDQINDGNDSPSAKKKSKKLDHVGKEDDDIDNDGDVDKSDKYLHARRKAIKKAVKEEAEQIDELKKSTLGSYVTKVAKLAPDQVKPSRREGIVKASQKLRKMDREDNGMKEEAEQIDEVLSKKASAGEWIKDFQSSDNPKFAGKSPEKRKQMALAAYYAKQRNEEVEEVDEAKLSPGDFMKGARRAGTGTDDQLRASASKKNAGPGSGKIRQLSKDELKRRGVKEEFSAEEIARLEEIAKKFD